MQYIIFNMRGEKQTFRLLAVVLLLLFASCRSQQSYTSELGSINEVEQFELSKNYQCDSVNNIVVELIDITTNDSLYLLEVRISNFSEQPYLVEPNLFNYITFDNNKKPLSSVATPALNINNYINELTAMQNQTRAEIRSKNIIRNIFTGIAFVAGFFIDLDNSYADELIYATSATIATVSDISLESSLLLLDEQVRELSAAREYSLFNTNLPKNTHVQGVVYFRTANNSAKYVRFNFPINNQQLEFVYKNK